MSDPSWIDEEWVVEAFDSLADAQGSEHFKWLPPGLGEAVFCSYGVVWKAIDPCGTTGLPGNIETTLDRAHGISALPDLYRAVEELLRQVEFKARVQGDEGHFRDAASRARAAMAKARGEAP